MSLSVVINDDDDIRLTTDSKLHTRDKKNLRVPRKSPFKES